LSLCDRVLSASILFIFCVCVPQKLVARKARKYEMQGNRLALPGLELTYLFHGIANAPRSVVEEKMMPEIDALISELRKFDDNRSEKDKEAHYGNGKGGYWDDYCLAMFLRGVCLRYIAYAVSDKHNKIFMCNPLFERVT